MEGERLTRRKSLVWNHFRESKDRRKAVCYHCSQAISIACGSLGNLNRHLRIKHGLTSDSMRRRASAGRAVLDFGRFLVGPANSDPIPVCEVCYLNIRRQRKLQTEVRDIANYGPVHDGLDPGLSVVNIVEVRSLEETPDTDDPEQAQDGLKKLTADVPVVLAEGPSLESSPPAETVKTPRPIFIESVDRAKKKNVREKDPDVDVDDDKFMSYFLKSKKQEFQESDELDLFFRSMCQTTKKMPLLYQIRVKKQIMNVVSEAEEELAGSTPGSGTTFVVASS